MNREVEKRLKGMAEAVGASVDIVSRGRHGRAMSITVRGKVVTLPIAGSSGSGHGCHQANAMAQLRRILRQAQPD